MICPTCAAEGKKSTVLEGYSSTTLAFCQPFYDEDGKRHHHDANLTRTRLTCSNGHAWDLDKYRSCWCGWSGGQK